MPRTSNTQFFTTRYERTGTRFRIYPQPDFEDEIVYIDAAPGTIRAGPQDEGIYVVDAKNKIPYDESGGWPPYTGRRTDSCAEPDPAGHFDHITHDNDAFSPATAFATIRLVLTIWEHYLGRKVRWYFRDTYPRLEVIPRVRLERNAFSKFGYIECGFKNPKTRYGPLCQNFDVVAHEVGHIILKDVIGYPPYRTAELRAHEEAGADLVAMVALLHFKSVVKHLLHQTKGHLYSDNALSCTGELTKTKQFRKAFNDKTMKKVKWDDDQDRYRYQLALPFIGATYDIFVEIYERNLVRLDTIPKKLADDSFNALGVANLDFRAQFAKHLKKNEKAFESALLHARDAFGRLLARTWTKTSMHDLTYSRVVENMIDADLELTRGKYVSVIRDSFFRRKIVSKAR